MKSNFGNLVKSFTYVASSNALSLCVSVLFVLVLPKLLSVEEYSFWQLYLFYFSYTCFLHFGLTDGLYLRYGGWEYDKLPRNLFTSQFYVFLCYVVLCCLCAYVYVFSYVYDGQLKFIYIGTAIGGAISLLQSYFFFILQMTNRIKEYAFSNVTGRLLFALFVLICIFCHVLSVKNMIILDVGTKMIVLLMAMYSCKELCIERFKFVPPWHEISENLKVGIKILIAYIASMLVIGIVRYGIMLKWGILSFGKLSLTFNISMFFLTFVNALSVVIFPFLKRISNSELKKVYISLREVIMFGLYLALLSAFAISDLLNLWLPKYSEALKYMAILFPCCIYECKISLLDNTFLKSLRAEKIIFKVNIVAVILSVIFTYVSVFLMENFVAAVFVILVMFIFRSVCLELGVVSIMEINIKKEIATDLFMTILFVFSSWHITGYFGFLLYLAGLCIYGVIHKKKIGKSLKEIQNI